MIKVGVLGAAGRMGQSVCAAVEADPETELVVRVDRAPGDGIETAIDAVQAAGADVVVDFTVHEAALANLHWCAANDIHAVVGTTGFSPAELSDLAARFEASTANAVIAPNFAIGAVLLMHLSAIAAPWFETGEIIELHHDAKVDAPSGTAMVTAQRLAEARAEWGSDPTTKTVVDGARGGVGPGGIHMHAVRMRGMVAHEEVILGTTGQTLTLRHDSYDRTSFMPGVLLAVKRVATTPGLTTSLDPLLGL